MKELGIQTVLTTDRHFSQAGFDSLPHLNSRSSHHTGASGPGVNLTNSG